MCAMTEFFSVILNGGLTSVFRDLKIRSSAVRKAGCQSVISEQSSQSFLCPPLEGVPKSLISRRGQNNGSLDGTKARRQVITGEQSSRKILSLSWERVSEGQERVNKNYSFIPTLSPSLINEGVQVTPFLKEDKIGISNKVPKNEISLSSNPPTLLSSQKKTAFTLAEVLITLGIIGVVAAMTMPVLISNIKAQQLRTAFLKGYSIISQAFELYNNDSNCTTTECLAYGMDFANEIRPYFKEVEYCVRSQHSKDYCFPISTTDTKYWNFSKKTKGIASKMFDDGQILTPDGMLITFEQQQAENKSIFIGLDINGRNRMPNVLGQDLFLFQIIDRGGRGFVVPVGRDDTDYPSDEYCNFESASRENGYGCAARALAEPDFFKKLK